MILRRKYVRPNGIFGNLWQPDGYWLFCTLEHSYPDIDGVYHPKITTGEYTCVRGQHKLEGMNAPFETFEITGVGSHTGLLFHSGNVNSDSSGCVLLGESYSPSGIVNSREAFNGFMELLQDKNTFQLTVEDCSS